MVGKNELKLIIDWVIDSKTSMQAQKELNDGEFWVKDWDAKKTEATQQDVDFIRKYNPTAAATV